MKVVFRNSCPTRVWVAYMYYNPDYCPDGGWGRRGWYPIDPGGEEWVLSTTNKYACFYAEGEDGRYWTGEYGPVQVTDEAFDDCADVVVWTGGHEGYWEVGMRLITLPENRGEQSATYRINLIP